TGVAAGAERGPGSRRARPLVAAITDEPADADADAGAHCQSHADGQDGQQDLARAAAYGRGCAHGPARRSTAAGVSNIRSPATLIPRKTSSDKAMASNRNAATCMPRSLKVAGRVAMMAITA